MGVRVLHAFFRVSLPVQRWLLFLVFHPYIHPFKRMSIRTNGEESERSNDYERRERSTNATIYRVSIPRPTTSSSFDSINSNRSFTYKEREQAPIIRIGIEVSNRSNQQKRNRQTKALEIILGTPASGSQFYILEITIIRKPDIDHLPSLSFSTPLSSA